MYHKQVLPNVWVVYDIFKDIDVDHNTLFTGEKRLFKFKNEHEHCELWQYEFEDKDNQFQYIHQYIKDNFIHKDFIVRKGVQEILHNKFIPPHSDQEHIGAITVFLNKIWEPHWGGHNCTVDDNWETVHSQKPVYGTGVYIEAPCQHFTLPVFSDYRRRTLQFFYDEIT